MTIRTVFNNTERIRRIRADIAAKEPIRDALRAAFLAGSTEVESYTLDTGDTSMQKTKFRSLKELYETLSAVEADLNRLYNQLSRSGLTNVSLRRRPYGPYYPNRNF